MASHDAPLPLVPPPASSRPTPKWVVHLVLVLVVGVACGAGTVVRKIGLNAGGGVSPFKFALYRQAIATPVTALWSCRTESRQSHPKFTSDTVWRSIPQLLLAGFFLFVSNATYTFAVKIGNPTIGAAWQTTAPVFCALAAVLLRVEQPTTPKIAGILVSFAGAAFFVLYGEGNDLKSKSLWLSHILFFINVNAWSFYSLVTRSLSRRGLPPLFVTSASFGLVVVQFMIAILILPAIPGAPHSDCISEWACWRVPFVEGWVLGYFVLVFSVLLYSTINWANDHVPPSTNFIYTPLQPATAAALSSIIVASGYNDHVHPDARLHLPGLNALGVIATAAGLMLVLRDEFFGRGTEEDRGSESENQPLLRGADIAQGVNS
eukprot:m.75899 g.75899  ORF g.75899 m.75899 type:complete len:377 (-) comp10464_c0_seq2:80-1210(-)